MLYEVVKEFSQDIFTKAKEPCISIYLPTHKSSPENKQDSILFKKLISDAEKLLHKKYPEADLKKLTEPLLAIKEDWHLWENATEGLCVLSDIEKCLVYRIMEPVKESVTVSDAFYVRPLIKFFQTDDKYILLALSRSKFTLYQGNKYEISEIELPEGTFKTIGDVLGEDFTQPYLTHGSYGGAGGLAMFHGHGDKNAETDKDTVKFFNYVDKFVFDNFSKNSNLPLILYALTEHHGEFRKLSKNPNLLKDGIKHSDNSIDIRKLKKLAWEVMEPVYFKKHQDWIDRYHKLKVNSLGENHLEKIIKAGCENRIEAVLIEADRVIPGKVDYEKCEFIPGDIEQPGYDDVLEEIAELVYKGGGEVIVLPKEKMPSRNGIAAIFRYYPTFAIESEV